MPSIAVVKEVLFSAEVRRLFWANWRKEMRGTAIRTAVPLTCGVLASLVGNADTSPASGVSVGVLTYAISMLIWGYLLKVIRKRRTALGMGAIQWADDADSADNIDGELHSASATEIPTMLAVLKSLREIERAIEEAEKELAQLSKRMRRSRRGIERIFSNVPVGAVPLQNLVDARSCIEESARLLHQMRQNLRAYLNVHSFP